MRISSSLNFKSITIMVIALAIIWSGFSTYSIAIYGTHSFEKPADGIVVLGAAVFQNKPSPVFQERINHGVTLYEQGLAPVIIFTGGLSDGQQMAEADVARKYAQTLGIPNDSILTEVHSHSTEQNLYFAKQLADMYNIESVIIVSDPLHMKRAMVIAKDVGLVGFSSPTPTSRYQSWKAKLLFLIREAYFYQRYLLRRPFYQFKLRSESNQPFLVSVRNSGRFGQV